ncbi:MAG: YdeI/OmpD-associated family protein [Thiotrichales bacterium]|nr:YdeI/OmpD-associated family protein [Thiotrichales bacterium]
MSTDYSKLKRERQAIPNFVKEALKSSNLMKDYLARPAYQQNDYLLWIRSAKTDVTKQKRVNQMLDELRKGGVYMKMPHPASAKK